MRLRGDGVSVGSDDGCVGECGDVPEATFVDVRHIHHDAQSIAGAHQLFTEVRQAGSSVGRVREQIRHPFAEIVGAAPHRSKRPKARLIEHLQRVKVRVDGLGALEMDDRRQRARTQTCFDLSHVAHHPHPSGRVSLQSMQDAQLGQGNALGITQLERARQPDG